MDQTKWYTVINSGIAGFKVGSAGWVTWDRLYYGLTVFCFMLKLLSNANAFILQLLK